MSASQLVRWQWEGYPRYHRSRFNLLLHIAAVPMFLVGNVALVAALAQLSWHIGIGAVVAMVLSVALQGRGHRHEPYAAGAFHEPAQCRVANFLGAVGHVPPIRAFWTLGSCSAPASSALTIVGADREE